MKRALSFCFFCIVIPQLSGIECEHGLSLEDYALHEAVSKHHDISEDNVFSLRELKCSSGHAYLFYLRLESDQRHAYSLIVTTDDTCGIRYIQSEPRRSELLLISH